MKHIKVWLAAIILLGCIPAFADGPATVPAKNDPFNEVVATYLAANPKPRLPEEARKFRVQAEYAIQEKQFDRAVELYGKALEIAPWWPQGHFNRALIMGEIKKYRDAISEMKLYVRLLPEAPDARAAKDKVYKWEGIVEEEKRMISPMMAVPGKNYEIGKYEVTQAQWESVMESNPSYFKGATLPVEQVSWNDIQEYLSKLNAKTGKQYRMPTEAEWEYACYGGNQTKYCGSDDVNAVAWYKYNSSAQTHPVGQKQANDYGLYDMSGNVWEWMSDCGRSDCSSHFLRGGAWDNSRMNLAGDNRYLSDTSKAENYLGFRLARTLP